MGFLEAKRHFIEDYFAESTKLISNQADIDWAIEKAYRDITLRTVAGAGDIPDLKTVCCAKVKELITRYFEAKAPANEGAFDAEHGRMCTEFLDCFNQKLSGHGPVQQYGKAQKIINMTFKYLYCYEDGEEKADYFQFCHMPIDSYILNWCAKVGIKRAKSLAWSKMTDVEYKYLCKEIRNRVNSGEPLYAEDVGMQKGRNVLECEFVIWQEEKKQQLLKSLKSSLAACKKDPYFKRTLSESDKVKIKTDLESIILSF